MKKFTILTILLSLAFFCREQPKPISGESPTFGKPRAPVVLKWSTTGNNVVNTPVNISISATPSVDVEAVTVQARLPEGVSLVSGSLTANAGATSEGGVISTDFTVTSAKEGLQYLGLGGTITINGNKQINNIVIPLTYGDGRKTQADLGKTVESNGQLYKEITVE